MASTRRPLQRTTDQIGEVGELLAALALSRPVLGRYGRALFRPTHLGGKYPVADFLVDALSPSGDSVGVFFVQVKSTTKPGSSRRLPAKATAVALDRLGRLPIPAYVVGVDLVAAEAYIAAGFGPSPARPHGITRRFPLSSDAVRIELYREVTSHWAGRRRPSKTRFPDV